MHENLKLSQLSNHNLKVYFKDAVLNERKITRHVLEYIAEIDRRRLYLENHTSLFDYLVKEVGYSPGAAMRRIDGARLLRELPEVAEKFETGSLTLSQATQVQRASRELKKLKNEHASTEEKRDLLLQIENRSQKETEQTIAAIFDLPVQSRQKEVLHQDQSVTLTLTLTPEQMQILEQVQNRISHSIPNKSWADVFTYLAKKEIARRTTVRASQQKPSAVTAAAAVKDSKNNEQNSGPKIPANHTQPSKRGHLPMSVRKALLHQEATCEYKHADGQKCRSKRFLQIDHIQSWSRGGTHDLQNLQVLCGVHNRLKYQREVRKSKEV